MKTGNLTVVCRVEDIPSGTVKTFDIDGRSIGVFNIAGRFYALRNRCPHSGAELCRGEVVPFVGSDAPGRYSVAKDRLMIQCPWHGWEFDLETGRSYHDPARFRTRSYDVERGTVTKDAEGTLRAQVFEVSIDGGYLAVVTD